MSHIEFVRSRFQWTAQSVADLKGYLANGASCGWIGRRLGITRNAVIGKKNRMGLQGNKSKSPKTDMRKQYQLKRNQKRREGRGGTVRMYEPRKPKPDWQAPQFRCDAATDLPAEQPGASACSLVDLTETTCRWPYGDPGTPEFVFCGAPPFPGMPYCGHHCALAYRPSSRAE